VIVGRTYCLRCANLNSIIQNYRRQFRDFSRQNSTQSVAQTTEYDFRDPNKGPQTDGSDTRAAKRTNRYESQDGIDGKIADLIDRQDVCA